MKTRLFQASKFISPVIVVACSALALSASFVSADTVTYNTAGTTSWLCPGGVTSIQVECWGGGGAGGAGRKDTAAGTNTSQNGGGGGGGAYAKKATVPVTPGQSYTITIPAAPVSGSAGTTTNGQGRVNGGTVTFVGDLSTTVTAAGGTGGANAYTTVNGTTAAGGGAGGTTAASIGDVGALFAGGAGAAATTGATNYSGGGGGGAGNAAVGSTSSSKIGAAGGTSGGGTGGDGRGDGNTNPGAGSPGITPGGGGGGGHNQGISTQLGGTGGLGQITLNYTVPPNFKVNNTDNLNLASSWTAFVPTGSIAEWNNTVTGANTTSLGADLTFSGIKISDPGGLVTVNTGNTVTVGLAATDLDLSAATQDLTLNCNLLMGGTNVWDVASSRTLTLGGAVSGSFDITKQGAGTAILSGANTYNGTTTVSAGTLVLSGSTTSTGNLAVGTTADKAVLNIPTGGTMTGGIYTVGSLSGSSAAMNIKGGTLTMAVASDNDASSFGSVSGAYGAFTISSGTYNQQRFMFGGTTSTATGGTGVGLIEGGIVNASGWIILARSGPADGTLTITNGTLNHASAVNDIAVGLGSPTAAANTGRAELNVAGGLIDNTGRRVTFSAGTGGSFHWAGTGVVNLNAGTLLTNSFNYDASSPNANSYVNFSGGTLKAATTSTTLLPGFSPSGTGINRVFVNGAFGTYAGGAVIDTNGFNSTIGADLLAPTGNGVSVLTIDNQGSGYIGAPAVKILDNGNPSTATAYAVVGTDAASPSTFGKLLSVVITNPGVITGTPTVQLVGGGGTGAAVSVSPPTPNTSGGLSKIGSGTLTLSGANTYSGLTSVTVDTLKFSTAGSGVSDVVVSGSGRAGALVAATDGQFNMTGGDLTLNNGTALVIDYGSTTPSTTTAPIKVDNFNVGTGLGLLVQGSSIPSLAVSQSYPLVTWTASGPANGSAFTTILTPRLSGTFSVSANTLFLTVTYNAAGLPISWNTGNGTWNTANTNWADANAASTTYIDSVDQVELGDAAGATGNPTITLNSTLSPAGVTMKSTSHDYTISGTGGIGGTGGLTLDATNSNTLTLATTNTYTGATAINGGTLKLSGGGTLGAASSTVSVSSGALLDLNGTNQNLKFAAGSGVGTVANNSGSGTSALTLSGTASINVSYITINDYTTTSGGKVAVVITANTQAPSNSNSYSGGTTVNSGAYFYLNGGATSGAGTGPINLVAPGTGATGNTGSGLLVDSLSYANDITGAGYIHSNSTTSNNVTFTGNLTNTGPYIWRGGTAANNSFDFAGNGTTSSLSGVIGSATSQVNGAVATGRIIKSGTGTLTLSGANVYTGGTTLSAGILIANNATALGTVAGPLALNGGTLDIQTGGTAYNTTVGGNVTILSNNAVSGAGTTKTLGNLSIGAFQLDVGPGSNATGSTAAITFGNTTLTGNATLNVAANSTLNLNGTVGGSSSLTVSGGGNVVFGSATAGALTFSGGLIVNSGGSASITNNNLITGTIPLTVDGTLTNGAGQIFGVLNGSGTINQVSNNLFTSSATNGSFSGTITGAGGYIKDGGSTQILTGLSSYTGQPLVRGGILSVNTIKDYGQNSALGAQATGSILIGNVATTGTLLYTGIAQSTNRIIQIGVNSTTPANTDTGGAIIQNDGSGALTFSAATFNSQSNAATGVGANRTLTLQGSSDGVISGAIQDNLVSGTATGTATVALTKSGSGTWKLSGANSYTGATTVTQGTLSLVGGSQASPVTVNAGASLGFTLSSPTTSTSSFNLSAGTIKITGTPTLASYPLITSSSGITGTPTLDSPISGYALQVSGNSLSLVQTGTPYSIWSGGAAFDVDTNGDGLKNGLAWVLGATDKNANAVGLLPTFDNISDPNYFIFTYRRKDDANTDANTTIAAQYGSDLSGWTTAVHDGTNIIITPTDNFYSASPGVDKVEVKVKKTLAVGGKLFTRLNVVQTP